MTSHATHESQPLQKAAAGSSIAVEQLCLLHRDRLKRMIVARMDPRLARRYEASDVIQDVHVEIVKRLPEFLTNQEMHFFDWVRCLARQKLAELFRRNIVAQSRDVRREIQNANTSIVLTG